MFSVGSISGGIPKFWKFGSGSKSLENVGFGSGSKIISFGSTTLHGTIPGTDKSEDMV
jgi:hypothetical protein